MYEKILIADDEWEIVSIIKDTLVGDGYNVLTAYSGEQAINSIKTEDPDLVILDIMMPDRDGYSVCEVIRDRTVCPIIFLSALESEADRIKGLAMGGDDYVTKPFSLNELKMRIKAHLRREKRAFFGSQRNFLRYRNLAIDIKGRTVYHNENEVSLTKREFDITQLLALHPGMIFSKEQIYEKVWGFDAVGDSAAVAEHIKKIRFKLNKADPVTEYITTVWGIGYKWERIK